MAIPAAVATAIQSLWAQAETSPELRAAAIVLVGAQQVPWKVMVNLSLGVGVGSRVIIEAVRKG